MLKTINGLSKVMVVRLQTAEAEKGFTFIADATKRIHGVAPSSQSDDQTETLLALVRPLHDLANVHLMQLDY